MSQATESPDNMGRGLLTDAERDAVQGREDDPNKQSTYVSRVKNRMERVREDARLLRKHRPEIYEQLHEAVCEEEIDERIERLEHEVEELRGRLDEDE